MPIVYNARWQLSTGTGRHGAKSAIYYERRTCFRSPGLYVDLVSRQNPADAVKFRRAIYAAGIFSGNRAATTAAPKRPVGPYTGRAFGLY
jgi:hypothetical protein